MQKVVSVVLNNFKNDSRVLKENISLQNAGYDVKVVALWEDGVKEKEVVQNIPVHRVRLTSKDWSKNIFVSFLKYLEWIYRIAKEYKNTDIFHCNDLNALPVGVVIKKLFNKNVKIVYDAHEYETETNGLTGIRKTLSKMAERYMIKYANKVITVSNAIADEYVKLYNIEKPALVLNTPPYKKIEKKDIFRETFNIPKDKTIFLYQGGLSSGRGIEILLETFKQLNKGEGRREKGEGNNILQPSTFNLQACIIFMGYGELEDEIKRASKEYDNIYFYPAVSPDILLEYTSSADFGILFYENNCLNHYYCSPNKMFEYLMAEIPVIASNLYEMKRLVENNDIGVVAKENTIDGLKDAI